MKQTHTPYEYPTITEVLNQTSIGRDQQLLFLEEKKNGQQITFGRWRLDLLETAGRFQQHSAKHIGVVCDLTYHCILCMYAVIVAGKVLVPLEANLTAKALDQYAEKADIDLLLYHDGVFDGEVSRCETMQIPDFLSIPAKALQQWPQWEGDRNACIFFTSGTEGDPLGVVLTQRNLSFTNSYKGDRKLITPPKILLFLPIHHVLSFVTLTNCIHDGCEIYLSRSIKYVSEELQRIKPDLLTTVPMVNELFRSSIDQGIRNSGMKEKIDALVRFSNALRKIGIDLRTPLFKKLRDQLGGFPQLIITGGSASSEDTIRFFDDIGILILQAYGTTETSARISSNSLKKNRIGSVGLPLGFTQVRIKEGEIQVFGDNIFREYYKNPQATQRAFDEGWFKTGDLGFLDQDGYLYLTGRKKNLIILDSGENVSPEELEKQLLRSSWISEVIVCERNKRIHAQVVAAVQPDMDTAELKQHIQETINELNRQNPAYKRIVSFELREEPFEKTSSLKIRR